VLRSGDAGYDEARTVRNGLIDKQPALIAQCSGAADVLAAVNFAREHDLLLSVKGGGHNVAGNAVCDGGCDRPLRMRGVTSIRAPPCTPGKRLGRRRPRPAPRRVPGGVVSRPESAG
jgi:FAD/FMN-containing dehydrogenase